MQSQIEQCLKNIIIGEKQSQQGMTVYPLFAGEVSKCNYLSLKQAMTQHLIVISELTEGGSVPSLKVINKADLPVLLLDGEEISGAKQNRILNTTILLKEHSETVIPVSCTEHGRWHYTKQVFEESGHMLAMSVREEKLADVTHSLKSGNAFKSNQGKVWEGISMMSADSGVHSETAAMKDVYEDGKVRETLKDYEKAFPLLDKQTGIIVCLGGKVRGLDCVSLPSVWADLHEKLIRSYAMECVINCPKTAEASPEKAQAFLDIIAFAKSESFASVGYGEDFRFESPEMIGAWLFWQDTFIHLEAYARTGGEQKVDIRYHSPRGRHQHWI
jgi:hypothetical protein